MPGFGILALCGYGALRRGATGGSLRWALAAQKRVPVRLILSPTRPWPLPRPLIHISEHTRLLSNSYAVFLLKKKKTGLRLRISLKGNISTR